MDPRLRGDFTENELGTSRAPGSGKIFAEKGGGLFYTYILASAPNGTLYTGHTDSLTIRVSQHRQELRQGFTSRYGVKMLVWYELHETREGAKARESQIKKWNRAWKVRLIRNANPDWLDLYDAFLAPPAESRDPASPFP